MKTAKPIFAFKDGWFGPPCFTDMVYSRGHKLLDDGSGYEITVKFVVFSVESVRTLRGYIGLSHVVLLPIHRSIEPVLP